MTVHFICACGKQLWARAERAGHRARCPRCRQAVVIPAPVGAPAAPPGRPAPVVRPRQARPAAREHLVAAPAVPPPARRPRPNPEGGAAGAASLSCMDCGRLFRVRRGLPGDGVRCPHCGAPQFVTVTPAGAMPAPLAGLGLAGQPGGGLRPAAGGRKALIVVLSVAAAAVLLLGAGGAAAVFWLRGSKADLHWATAEVLPAAYSSGTDRPALTAEGRARGLVFIIVEFHAPDDTGADRDLDHFQDLFQQFKLFTPGGPVQYPFQVNWMSSKDSKDAEVAAIFVGSREQADAGALEFQYRDQPPVTLSARSRR